eukprot:1660908-Rhodomonas_salina.1
MDRQIGRCVDVRANGVSGWVCAAFMPDWHAVHAYFIRKSPQLVGVWLDPTAGTQPSTWSATRR